MYDNDYIKKVTWSDVGSYLNAVSERVNSHDFSGVYGIPRGGSVLGAWLAHKLYLPLLSEVNSNCIIVDDVCDSGHTLRELIDSLDQNSSQCFVTVMFYNLDSSVQVDYFYSNKEDNWVAFPWEE